MGRVWLKRLYGTLSNRESHIILVRLKVIDAVFYSTLKDPEIKRVCLFVDPANVAAARVYGRVGFIGLETGVPDDRTEEVDEVGFEGVALLDLPE